MSNISFDELIILLNLTNIKQTFRQIPDLNLKCKLTFEGSMRVVVAYGPLVVLVEFRFSITFIEFITYFHEFWIYETWTFSHKICCWFWSFLKVPFSEKEVRFSNLPISQKNYSKKTILRLKIEIPTHSSKQLIQISSSG